MKTIHDCEVPNPADDIIFCTRTWHSDSSSSTSGRRELGLGLQSDCDSEAVSSHDKKRATVSVAEDLDAASENKSEEINIIRLSNGEL